MSTKNPLTPTGIETATYRFVAQHLNRTVTAVPPVTSYNNNISNVVELCYAKLR